MVAPANQFVHTPYTITALKSGPNATFNNFIEHINDDIESGTGTHKDIHWRDLIIMAKKKYGNMDATNDWDKVDPINAQMLALGTRLDQLKKDTKPPPPGGSSGSPPDGDDTQKIMGVEQWRTIFKGATIQRYRKTWYWCPYHKHTSGAWDGLYCTHSPENHDASCNRRGQRQRGQDTLAQPSGNDQAKKEEAEKKLIINQRLKEVLCSKLMLSDSDADNICKEVAQGN